MRMRVRRGLLQISQKVANGVAADGLGVPAWGACWGAALDRVRGLGPTSSSSCAGWLLLHGLLLLSVEFVELRKKGEGGGE